MTTKVLQTCFVDNLIPIKAEICSDVMFVSGALQAAKYSSPAIRRKILSDVQKFTNISASEIEFMFNLNNNNNDHNVFDMPDADRRRAIIRMNNLDAAE